MGLHQIDSVANYVRFLRENPHEIDLLFKELLIGVTSFFRDPAAWDHLPAGRAAGAVSARSAGGRAAGLGAGLLDRRGSLFARDGVPGGGRAVQAGEEPASCRSSPPTSIGTPSTRRARVCTRTTSPRTSRPSACDGSSCRRSAATGSRKEIREMVVFAPQNVIMDPPFTKLDILACRNLLIYLSAELQKKLIPLFHYSLQPGRRPVPRQRGDDRHLLRAVRAARRQDAPLSAARSVGRDRPGRVPCDGLRRAGSGGRRGRQPGAGTEAAAHQSAGARRSRCIVQRYRAGRRARATTRATSSTSAAATGKYLEPAGRQGEPERLRDGARGPALRAVAARSRRRCGEDAPVDVQRPARWGRNGGTQHDRSDGPAGWRSPRSCAEP